jgi:hypothetical protein
MLSGLIFVLGQSLGALEMTSGEQSRYRLVLEECDLLMQWLVGMVGYRLELFREFLK